MDDTGRTIVILFAHHVEHVPPPVNLAAELSFNGYRVLLVGYRKYGVSKFQRLGANGWIFRMQLSSSGIRIGFIRKIFALIEFIIRSRSVVNKLKPDYLITFNEVASIVHRFRFPTVVRKYNWQLEFPEEEHSSFFELLLKKYTIKMWKYADVMVFPTLSRYCMASVLNPSIIYKKVFTIHNAPLQRVKASGVDENGVLSEALRFLESAKKVGKYTILYTGAVGNRYGWDSIIKAVVSRNDFALLILGTKHDLGRNEFAQAIEGAVYPQNVCWLDPVPYSHLQSVLSFGDIGFVTYRGDTLNTKFSAPGKIYEYLKAGLIIFTDENSCINEAIVDAECGVLFPSSFDEWHINLALDKVKTLEVLRGKANSADLFKRRFAFEMQLQPLLLDLCEHVY